MRPFYIFLGVILILGAFFINLARDLRRTYENFLEAKIRADLIASKLTDAKIK